MQLFLLLCFLILLLCQTTLGMDLSHLLRSGKSYTDDTDIPEMPPKLPLGSDTNSDGLQYNNYELSDKNTSEAYRLDEENMGSTANEISTSITDDNQSHGIENSTTKLKSDYSTSISTTQKTIGNSTTFSQSSPAESSNELSTHASGQNDTSSETSIMTSSNKLNQSSTQSEDEEPERVVIGTPSNSSSTVIVASQPKSIYQKTLELINDTYTLSILLPIAAGVVFASTIIVVIATCRCIRRQCWRRRLRKKKALPDSVKNLRPSDRARLLAETSDEEF